MWFVYSIASQESGTIWGLWVWGFKEVLFDLALDGLPILTGGQNVPPEGGSWNGFLWGGFSLVGYQLIVLNYMKICLILSNYCCTTVKRWWIQCFGQGNRVKAGYMGAGIPGWLCLLFLWVGLFSMMGCQQQSLNTYIPYEPVSESDELQLKVNGEKVFVGKEHCFGDSIFNTSQFFVNGETSIEIESSDEIDHFEIRPYHLNIKGEVNGNRLVFSVAKPQMLYVTINDHYPLCLFQTPPEKDKPGPEDAGVLYFSKGVVDAGVIRPVDGQTIYLEQGAWVKGRIYAENVRDVTIKGRGIIDARGYTSKPERICGIEFKNCRNIKIEGIGLRTGEWWQSLFILSDNIEIEYMNLMSFGVNNDGIDIDGVTNFRASNCFIGCGDDGFGWHALDAEANGEPPTRNCLAEDCVIYNAHAGNGLRVGASMETELFEDITFRNITILTHKNAAIRSDHSDWALCRNIRFENFYIEQPGRPIEIAIEKTRYSNNTGFRDERGHFDGLYFQNITSPGGIITLKGYDENHLIENVKFINCKIGGNTILSEHSIVTNEFVRNITFEK